MSHAPQHKDYLPDKTIVPAHENESEYHEEDEQPGEVSDDYEPDYEENGMQDKRKKKK